VDLSEPGKGLPFSGPQEFIFNVNPRSLSMDEAPAVEITATLGHGQFVEHAGNLFKTVTLSGTTGLRPNRKRAGTFVAFLGVRVPPVLGGAPNSDDPAVTGERTGFDDLIDLRNLFRRYWAFKADPAWANKVAMVWHNGKEAEAYVVEPEGPGFKTISDASSPVTMSYEIQFRTLGWLVTALTDFNPAKAAGSLSWLQRITQFAEKISAALGFLEAVTDRFWTVAHATVNQILSPVRAILNGLQGIVRAGARILSIPRALVHDTLQNVVTFLEALDAIPAELNAYRQTGVLTQVSWAAHFARSLASTLSQIAAEPNLFARPLASLVRDRAERYGARAGFVTHSSDLRTATPGSAASEDRVRDGETIRGLARRLLGDAGMWKEIVLLNNLRAPYLSSSGDGVSVLRPNDRVLYPVAGGEAGDMPASSTREAPFRRTSSLADVYGLDIAVKADGFGGFATYTGDSGDYALVYGAPNVNQWINLALRREPGELPAHPRRGTVLAVGKKYSARSIIQLDTGIRAELLADPRIADVRDLVVEVEGNTNTVTATVPLTGSGSALALNHEVRR